MSLRQLLPILDIIGTANKHLARVAKFMQKYADMELFPVKLQVRPAPYVKAVKVGMGPCTLPRLQIKCPVSSACQGVLTYLRGYTFLC